MTELSFLIDLLINPRDSEQLKKDLAARIKEVETELINRPVGLSSGHSIHMAHAPKLTQAPSTLAAMAKHGDIPQAPAAPIVPDAPPPPLTGGESQARLDSMEILKRNKNKPMSTR